MVAMAQPLDARRFFFHPQLRLSKSSALVLKVRRSRVRKKWLGGSEVVPWFCGHEHSDWSRSVLRQQPEEMSNFVQPHDGKDISMHACLARRPLKRRTVSWGRHEFVSTGLAHILRRIT